MRYLRYLPEVISNLAGALAWHRIAYVVMPHGFGLDVWYWVMVYSLGAVLVAAPFYRLMKKPKMRRHFAIYMIPLLILAPRLLLYMLMYSFTNLLLIVFFAAVPAFPIVAIYERLFSYRFAKSAGQGSGDDERA